MHTLAHHSLSVCQESVSLALRVRLLCCWASGDCPFLSWQPRDDAPPVVSGQESVATWIIFLGLALQSRGKWVEEGVKARAHREGDGDAAEGRAG